MKVSILVLLLLIIVALPIYSEENRIEENSIFTLDIGFFSGFFSFGYERLEGLTGHKIGLGVIDSQSIRAGYAYKRYFPDRAYEEERPSRIYFGPLVNLTLEEIYPDIFVRGRLGVQMGYDFIWGADNQYYASLAGGFALIYPPLSYYYYYFPENNRYAYYDLFTPGFTMSFGYRY